MFIGAWKVWFKRFSDHEAWREGELPAAPSDEKLHELIEGQKRFSLEVINRLMVPWSYRDSSQISEAFYLMNPDIIRAIKGEEGKEEEKKTCHDYRFCKILQIQKLEIRQKKKKEVIPSLFCGHL